MEERNGKLRCLELKICERCGGLWLRPAGTAWAYCRGCKLKIDDLPDVRKKSRGVSAGVIERAS